MYCSNFFKVTLCIFAFLGCDGITVRSPTNKSRSEGKEASIKLAKQIYARELENIRKFVTTNAEGHFRFHENGFWYHMVREGSGKKVKRGDSVTMEYKIFNLKGHLFYDTQTKTFSVDKEVEIAGLSEGVKLMNEGARYDFVFPSYKAYGYLGDNKKILPNTTLLCEVKILKIINQNKILK